GSMIGPFGGRRLCSGAAALLLFAGCQSETSGALGDVTPLEPGATVPGSAPELPVAPPGATALDCSQVRPGAAEARLLTRLQYDNTVRDLLGDTSAPAQGFPPENTMLGFGNNAGAHRASLLLAEEQLAAAEELAARTVARGLDSLLPCEAGDRSEACAERFVTEFGYRAYRRPLTAEEAQPLVELFRAANGAWGFDKAIELLLQS